ncbi:MAG: Holliday junction resolvase RuvX [Caldilineaceae bacterium]|nr:Holliday junction resolvase RuvX [Caldilineaceae bacterium]HRJ44214.1 Holliday junction resolvase RuvX [Caldilineaceae bacterium]
MSVPPSLPPIKLIALDVGLARIGVATCDPLGITVRPLAVIQRRSRQEDFDRLVAIVAAEEAEAVVCGLPLSMDGSESEQTKMTRTWALRLARTLRTARKEPLPVIFWDERLSSFAAQEMMADDPKRAQAIGEDAYAAAVILRSYLDARKRGEGERWGGIVLEKK